MKKLVLSLCLLGVAAPHAAQAAWGCPMPGMIKGLCSVPNAKKALLIGALGWYYFIWRSRQPIDIDEDWAWSHVITRFGEEGYCKEVLTGNREIQREVEFTEIDQESGLVITVTESEVTVPAYGILGMLDALIMNKLIAFSKFLKAVGHTRDFVKDPFALFSLEDKNPSPKST
jgi:hypothetical protein